MSGDATALAIVTVAAEEPSGTRITGAELSDFNSFAALSKDAPSPRTESKSISEDFAIGVVMRALKELMTKESTAEDPARSAAVAIAVNFILKNFIMIKE
jgi:hypothetical protein